MASSREVWRYTKNKFRSWLDAPHMLALIMFLVLLALKDFLPLRAACQGLGYRVTVGYFALYLGSSLYKQFLLCVVLLFSDAPFINELSPYEWYRGRRRSLILANTLYSVLASWIFLALLFLLSLLILFPYVTFTGEWGKVLHTLVSTRRYAEFPVPWLAYQEIILKRMLPGRAFLAALAMVFSQSLFLSSMMQAIALARPRSKNAHTLGAMAYIFLPDVVKAFGVKEDLQFLPASWMQLTYLNLNNSAQAPTPNILTAILLLGILTVICLFVCYRLWLKADIYQYLGDVR